MNKIHFYIFVVKYFSTLISYFYINSLYGSNVICLIKLPFIYVKRVIRIYAGSLFSGFYIVYEWICNLFPCFSFHIVSTLSCSYPNSFHMLIIFSLKGKILITKSELEFSNWKYRLLIYIGWKIMLIKCYETNFI